MTEQRTFKRALITGATGFVGSHLVEYMLEEHPDVEIFCTTRWRSPKDHIKNFEDKVTWIEADLIDLGSIIRAYDIAKPDVLFHLAAQSYVVSSYSTPGQTIQANVNGTLNILEGALLTKQDPIMHICSSSEVYGQVTEDDVPIDEDCPLRPASPYAVGKVGTDMLAYQYFCCYGLKTIRTRMFTHTGPRRGHVFVVPAFARQIARIIKGMQEPVVKVGNLQSVRTFADVRDTVRAYWLLAEKCTPGEAYNIGGNRVMTIGEMLDMLLETSGMKDKIKVEVDPKLLRPADVTLQIPSIDKFVNETGWQPEIPFEDTLRDILDYELELIS